MRFTAVMLLALLAAQGCKKKAAPPPAVADNKAAAAAPRGEPNVGVGDGAPMAAGGGGTIQAVKGAVQRVVTMAELKSIQTFIEFASGASGTMPTPAETLAAIKREDPKTAGLIEDGSIVLHPAKAREGVWAYEKKAGTEGGLVLTNNGVERMDAATLRQKLGH